MGKIRRGNHFFITYKGDHNPRHVHVHNDGGEIGRWDLERKRVMEGKIPKKVKKIILELIAERKL